MSTTAAAAMSMTGSVKKKTKSRKSISADDDQDHRRSSVIPAAGLAGAGSTSAIETINAWATRKAKRMGQIDLMRRQGDKEAAAAAGDMEQETRSPQKVSFLNLFSFATRREQMYMVCGLIGAAVSGFAMPVWLILLAQSLETFNNIGTIIRQGGSIDILMDQMNALIYSFAILGAVSLVSGSTYVAFFTFTGERQALRIREEFVKSAFRQEAAWFDERGDPQELPTLTANALARISTAIGRQVADTFANLLSALGCLAVSIVLDPPLALFMVCMLPVIAIAVAVVGCFMRKESGLALEQFASAGGFATEVIGGIKTIASLLAESWAMKRYKDMCMLAQKHSISSGFLTKLASGIMGLLFYCTYTFAFIFGTEQVAQTQEVENSHWNPFHCMFNYCGISGSEVMVCIYGIIVSAQFFALMSPGLDAINRGRTAAVEIFGAINRKPKIDGSANNVAGTQLGDDYDGSLEFRGVVFAYPSRPELVIFNNFNLRVEPGSSVALVGPSGSGKSTISRLLLRLYDPIAGDILVGGSGVPLRDINLHSWRSKIGYVQQEPSLFPGSLWENIASGKAKDSPSGPATDKEVEAAARAACCHDFIMELPDKYQTVYSGASMFLSGGQVQRISIARALMRNPAILLLDEATSALDTQSEKTVQDALANIRRTRKLTTVTVAHRLSTIVSSDKICVIAEGAIQEQGNHRELFEEGGIYAQLCEGQGLDADAADNEAASQLETKNGWTGTGSVKKEEGPAEAKAGDLEAGVVSTEDKEVEDDELVEEEMASMSQLLEYNKKDMSYLVLGLIGSLVVGALPPCEGILFGKLTANYFTVSDADEMRALNFRLSYCFLALAGGSILGNMAQGSGFSVSGYRLTRRLRTAVFERIMRHGMGWFDFPEHSVGELTTRLEEDAEAVSHVTGVAFGQKVQIMSSLLGGIVISMVFSWQIGLIALGCVPFIIGASVVQAKCTKQMASSKHDGISAATIMERGFHDIFVLQAYNLQDETSDKYSAALVVDVDQKAKQGLYTGLVFGFSQFATFATFAVLFYAGIELMIAQKVAFEDFFVALLAVMFAAFGVGQTSSDFGAKRRGLTAAARIFDIIDQPLDEDDPLSTKGSKPDSVEGSVRYQDVGFTYPTRRGAPVFYPSHGQNGLSLAIASKESVAFTGRSGCGKSTVLQLLLKFYKVDSGAVLLDKNSLEQTNTAWLRSCIGYVGQMPVLFQGSIRDNIRLGKPDATDAEITKACEDANCTEFIERLSDKYDTDIGAGGSRLSGGQRQRVAIARSIVKDPQILVLDEATAALDSESEKIVQSTLDEMHRVKPRTTLTVAHRLETIKNCDKIVVLDRGGVHEQGSHSELLDLGGIYSQLWKKQGSKTD